jgi:hypothetical protein
MASNKFLKDVSTAKKRDYAQILAFAQVVFLLSSELQASMNQNVTDV